MSTPCNMDEPVPPRRITVEQYHRLAQHGVLTEDDRVELLEGWLVVKARHTPAHAGTNDILDDAIGPLIPSGWRMRTQRSITTADSEPEPDVIVVRGHVRSFAARHPRPDEIALVVEIADSSLTTDRGIKARLYARAGIPCYWIVNLIDGQLEVLTDPGEPGDAPAYATRQVFGPDDEVPFVLEGKELARIAVRELLP